tara:strand:+ start:5570 stop:5980 length:411 start_codon:yes stop_codon:yes gene_type:complete
MTILDTPLRKKVYDAIQTYGKTMTFHSNASTSGHGTYNPATGIYESVPSPVTLDYKASPPSEYNRNWRDGDNVQEGDVMITLPALNLNSTFENDALRVGMKVVIDSATFVTESLEKIYSGEEICAYGIRLRARRDA